jgi:two-component system, response regulator
VTEAPVEILLVEDNPSDVELALHAFARGRVANTIQVAGDGEQALDFLFRRGRHSTRANHRPRVVLLDLKLPKVDGLEVLRAVRADADLRTLPVVVLTSSREERDVVESYRLGVNSYIVKPIDFEKLLEAAEAIGFYWLMLNEPPPDRGEDDG